MKKSIYLFIMMVIILAGCSVQGSKRQVGKFQEEDLNKKQIEEFIKSTDFNSYIDKVGITTKTSGNEQILVNLNLDLNEEYTKIPYTKAFKMMETVKKAQHKPDCDGFPCRMNSLSVNVGNSTYTMSLNNTPSVINIDDRRYTLKELEERNKVALEFLETMKIHQENLLLAKVDLSNLMKKGSDNLYLFVKDDFKWEVDRLCGDISFTSRTIQEMRADTIPDVPPLKVHYDTYAAAAEQYEIFAGLYSDAVRNNDVDSMVEATEYFLAGNDFMELVYEQENAIFKSFE